MKKPWSISTTVRNPDRVFLFLQVLEEMAGEDFDKSGQAKFQTLLIQNRLYRPTGLSTRLLSYYDTTRGEKMSISEAGEVFEHMKSRSRELRDDEGLRGRTSVAPLTKMGLAFAKQSSGKIVITELGQAFLKNEIDIGDVYFRFFLKWQIPNPESKDYADDGTYNIKPFIGALHLINAVNKKELERGKEPKGLSKEEFALFVPSLVHFNDINSYAAKIIRLRDQVEGKSKQEKRDIFNNYRKEFAIGFLQTTDRDEVEKFISNLRDYGDNAIRYFRLTRYFHIRGNGFYIDLEPRRDIEINNLISYDNAAAINFESNEKYLEYISDISQPRLPWETKDKYIEIIQNILVDIAAYEQKLNLPQKHRLTYQRFSRSKLKTYTEQLRLYRRTLQEEENHRASQDVKKIREYIGVLKDIYNVEDKPIVLEKYISLALNALNDALQIKPNYPVGDDNEPTFTAPANTPDIECYYKTHNAICEVTMLTARDQWYNEGQPVMRHLRDFENKNSDKTSYCLFVAPKFHRDTVNTFWMAVKYEYEGKPQKIIPLSIAQVVRLLEILVGMKAAGIRLEHAKLSALYEEILAVTGQVNDSAVWIERIPAVINAWGTQILTTQPV